MQLFLSYKSKEPSHEEISNEYNDEIFEKPHLSRSTNQHEWNHIYPLEI